jgi:UPF0716 protein FxsA
VPALLVAALVIVPLVEIYVLVQVGQVIGALPTIALLLVMSLLGAYLLRREGTKTWRAFRSAMGSGRVPAREVADGALVIFGGALLLTPGFATDIFGLLCVLPPTRAVLRRLLTGAVAKRLGVAGLVGGIAADRSRQRPDQRRGGVVEGEVIDGGDTRRNANRPPPEGGGPSYD